MATWQRPKEEIFEHIEPEYAREAVQERIRHYMSRSRRKVVVLDDDPTGTQTVHDVTVITRWDVPTLVELFRKTDRVFYILTNSRSVAERQAISLTREIVGMLCEASHQTGIEFSLVSRSDSTLRGHYPAEVDEAMEVLNSQLGIDFAGQVILPAFFEGGRYTIDDIHWVEDQGTLVPVGQTEFAKDPAFGFTSSNLCEWVASKTAGRVKQSQVYSIPLSIIRQEGPDGVSRLLHKAASATPIICNAASYADIEVLVAAFIKAEANGKHYIYRTAASFVPIYGGVPLQPPLSPEAFRNRIANRNVASNAGGLIVVGSHVKRSTGQLEKLIETESLVSI
jgi:uncharacterized protein YgbK (DUF1537 family)